MMGKTLGWLMQCLTILWCALCVPLYADELAPPEEKPPLEKDIVVPDTQPSPDPQKNPGKTTFDNIVVIGSNQQIRGSIASMAKAMHAELNALLNDKSRKLKIPLIIRLHGKIGDPAPARTVASEIRNIQGQYQFLVHVHLASGIEREKLRYYLMEMFLYERGLSEGQAVEEEERVIVKPWIAMGLLEMIDLNGGRGNRAIYQSKMPFLKRMPLQQVFDSSDKEWRKLDGQKSVAFRVISGALVNSLIRQPKGKEGMVGYLKDVATYKGETENLLRKHFPSMNKSRSSLEKWVGLGMSDLGTARNIEVFSILETERRLESILKLRYRDNEQMVREVGVNDFQHVLELKTAADRAQAVAGALAELERMSYRCFPSYRPILLEYGMVLQDIVQMKAVRTIPGRLKNLRLAREKNIKAAQRTRDYLDWYYITQTDEVSADFEEYRRLFADLEKEHNRVRVNSNTGKYLDDVQRLFGGR